MNAIGTRLARLERMLVPDRETGRIIQCMGSRQLTDDTINDWLRGRGVDLRPTDRVIFRNLVGIDPVTRAHVYSGEMGAITVYDPATGQRQTYAGEDTQQ